jgi:hypothetical protein
MEHNDGDALAAKLGREPTKTIQQALLLMKAGILPTNIKTSPLVIKHGKGKSPCFLGKSLCFIMLIYFQKGHLHHSKVSSNNQRVTLGELAAGTIWISARDVERSLPAWEEEIHILRLLDSTGEDNLGPIKGPMATRIFFGSPKTILTSKCPEIWQK